MLAAAASAVLCVGVCVLWMRSYRSDDADWHVESGPNFKFVARQAQTRRGILSFDSIEGSTYQPPPPLGLHYGHESPFFAQQVSGGAFGFGRTTTRRSVPFYSETRNSWASPLWFPAGLFLIAPAAWWLSHQRRATRLRVGACPSCGCDLRATPGRCRECGTVPAAAGKGAA
jgi:hypothetical protein